jgi:hypothetical protein
VKGDALRRLRPNARQATQLVNELLNDALVQRLRLARVG